MTDDTLPLTPESAPEPVPPPVPEPVETSSEPTPLDQATLSEFVKRRAKGEQAAPTDKPELDGKTGSDPDDVIPGKPDLKTVPKTRFDQIYRQRSEFQRQVDAEKARSAQLEAELQQLRQKPPAAPPEPGSDEPVLDDYLKIGRTYEDWMDARIEWRATKVAEARIEADRQRIAQQAAEQERLKQLSGFGERTEAAKTKYADYDEKVIANDKVRLSPVITDVVTRSPHGPDIMYWLGTHETEANILGEQSRHYGPAAYPLMEAHLLLLSGQSMQPTTGARKAVPVSNAPAPISPVGGGSSTTTVSLDQVSLGDYVKQRNAADLKKRTG